MAKSKLVHRSEVKGGHAQPIPTDTIKEIFRLDNLGVRKRRIAEWLGINVNTVSEITRGISRSSLTGVDLDAGRISSGYGQRRANNTKLTETEVHRILDLLEDGYTRQSIADEFGVHVSTISGISRGITWSHVTGITRKAVKERSNLNETVLRAPTLGEI